MGSERSVGRGLVRLRSPSVRSRDGGGAGVAIGLDPERPIETSTAVLPGDVVCQLHQLLLAEAILEPLLQIVGHVDRRSAEDVGELDDQSLIVGQVGSFLPVGDGVDGVLTETQLTAECDAEILSPKAANQ